MPVVNYVFNYDFYKNVLCENKAKPELKCNGKCHLAKEIKIAKEQENNSKLPIPKLDYTKIPVSLIEKQIAFTPFVHKGKSIAIYGYLKIRIYNVNINVLTPPPDKIG